jgi:hypothetical protein
MNTGLWRMSNKLIVKGELTSREKVLHQYQAKHRGHIGRLILTNHKLIFMVKQGFFRIHYEPVFKIPYDQIDVVRTRARYAFELESKHTPYCIMLLGATTADIIVDEIKHMIVPLDYPQRG